MGNGIYACVYAWTLDFWRAFMEKPKIIRWLCLKLMGRYARNELFGAKMKIEENGDAFYFRDMFGYNLEDMDYHTRLDKYQDW